MTLVRDSIVKPVGKMSVRPLSLFVGRFIVKNLRALQEAAFAGRERLSTVHGGAIVPHDDIAKAPVVSPDETRLCHVSEQDLKKLPTLAGFDPNNLSRKLRADE